MFFSLSLEGKENKRMTKGKLEVYEESKKEEKFFFYLVEVEGKEK